MPKIKFNNKTFESQENQSVLDTLLQEGEDILYSCKSGLCGACTLRVEEGKVNPEAQATISEKDQKRGLFLSCCCYPKGDIKITTVGTDNFSIELLDKTVLQGNTLRLRTTKPFDYYPGQFLNLIRFDGLTRAYSIASHPTDPYLEFHIKIVSDGFFSSWAESDFHIGDSLNCSAPMGDCYYTGNSTENVILAGIGTGMAPLFGILKELIHNKHQGSIEIFNGASKSSSIYFSELVQDLDVPSNVSIFYSSQVNDAEMEITNTNLDEAVMASSIVLADSKAFICGSANTVKRLSQKLFLAGLSSNNIKMDSFVPFKP